MMADEVVLLVLDVEAPEKFHQIYELHPLVAVEIEIVVPLVIAPATGENVGAEAGAWRIPPPPVPFVAAVICPSEFTVIFALV